MKLGGWQRLWIVLSFIWLLPVALLTLESLRSELTPKISPYEQRRYNATRDLIQKEASLEVKVADGMIIVKVPKRTSKADLEQLYTRHLKRVQPLLPLRATLKKSPSEKRELDFDMLIRPDDELNSVWRHPQAGGPVDPTKVRQLQEEYGKWMDFSEVESTYKNNLRPLRWEKAKFGMYGVLAWLASIGLLYLLGATIGWIVRGFKTK